MKIIHKTQKCCTEAFLVRDTDPRLLPQDTKTFLKTSLAFIEIKCMEVMSSIGLKS